MRTHRVDAWWTAVLVPDRGQTLAVGGAVVTTPATVEGVLRCHTLGTRVIHLARLHWHTRDL